MPQMAPIYWLFMFLFFIMSFWLFFMINYFMKPFNKIDSFSDNKKTLVSKSWKL
uniref:ATP synthase F0 subunit 8 n=1 Tax=Tritodynamia horvathi TaxID=585954 RepID=UPI00202941FB|nr:ATP synthase F0 subunit 8 [Tritodynamia horvathi]UPM51602.1 ATP synthase F0 subunit 8 [Tritodynamia horvathi]